MSTFALDLYSPQRNAERVFESLYWVRRVSKFALGVVGILLASVFLLPPLYLILYILTYWLKRSVRKSLTAIYNEVHLMSDEEKINTHLEIEIAKKSIKNSYPLNEIYQEKLLLWKPIKKQLLQVQDMLTEAEMTLRKAAYPDINKPLTSEQQNELSKKFSDFEDWDDPELDVYKSYYCPET